MSLVSIILNVYKRPYTLETQIEAIKNQSLSVRSEDIHVWYNNVEGLEQPLPKDPKIKTYKANWNTKFFGRFTIPLMCRTPYIAMFDDDVVPGTKWLEHCFTNIEKQDGILGGSGIILHEKRYRPNTVVGWNGMKSKDPIDVDLVGHAWFFKQEYAKFMWEEEPPSWDNGEDMFFSYMAKKHGIKTYVPAHPSDGKEFWSNDPSRDNNWGYDKNAHSLTHNNHLPLRNNIVGELIKIRGWKTIRNG
tara:strand:- start:60644 stop:61381 length:738 start_codon:yes stop_codon:yes gene_type:complete